jgi:hypothetical protein
MRDHSPASKAWRAAATARSMSAASPAGTRQNTSPLAGSITGRVSPLTASTRCPPIIMRWGASRKAAVPAPSSMPCSFFIYVSSSSVL